MRSKAIALVALLTIGCGHIQYIQQPSQAASLAEDYQAVFEKMQTSCEAKALEDSVCADWELFDAKFQMTYVAMGRLFAAALVAKDEDLQEACLQGLSLMIPELFKFANIAGVKLQSVK